MFPASVANSWLDLFTLPTPSFVVALRLTSTVGERVFCIASTAQTWGSPAGDCHPAWADEIAYGHHQRQPKTQQDHPASQTKGRALKTAEAALRSHQGPTATINSARLAWGSTRRGARPRAVEAPDLPRVEHCEARTVNPLRGPGASAPVLTRCAVLRVGQADQTNADGSNPYTVNKCLLEFSPLLFL